MYNFAKLLTEEPEKIERIGILFLKLLVTLFIGSQLCGFNISIFEFLSNPIPQDYTVSKCILFCVLLIFIWYIVWTFLAEITIYFLIRFFARTWNGKVIAEDSLRFLSVIKKKNGSILPDKNILHFNEIIQSYNDEAENVINEGKSRLVQYLVVLLVVYVTLLFAKDMCIPTALHWICVIMLFNLLILNSILHKMHEYFKENLGEMRKQYSILAYVQTIMNGINQIQAVKSHYEIDGPRARIWLKKKASGGDLPQSLKIYPVFHWNDTLLKQVIRDEIIVRRNRNTDKPHHYDIVICNVAPNPEDTMVIEAQPGFAFLHCENEEQVYRNFELFLYQAARMYKLGKKGSNSEPTA